MADELTKLLLLLAHTAKHLSVDELGAVAAATTTAVTTAAG